MTTNTITEAPVAALSNGLRVANFSSNHPFNFVDGSVLPPCDNQRCAALSMERKDEESEWPGALFNVQGAIRQVKPVFVLTDEVVAELTAAEETWDVDIVLVPFPLLQALRDAGVLDRFTKIGTVIMADRITKAAAIDRFGR